MADADSHLDSAGARAGVRITIATLVNDRAQYVAMRTTFENGGFTSPDCEFLHIDNTGPEQTCAYRGLNRLLDAARGAVVILCHQDVRLLGHGRADLDARLAELEALDSDWALAGNAGGVVPGRLAIRITDPHGTDRSIGTLPARVASLDENFIVVKRSARLGFSRDLTGFHFYGADICLVADLLGCTAYVIDFHLRHLSAGAKGDAFRASEAAFRKKWAHALRPRWIQTTCSLLKLSGAPIGRLLGRLAEAPMSRISRRLPGAAGFVRRHA